MGRSAFAGRPKKDNSKHLTKYYGFSICAPTVVMNVKIIKSLLLSWVQPC